jgi:hypothetical protein
MGSKVPLEEDADLLTRCLVEAGEDGLSRTHITTKVFSYRRHRHEVDALINMIDAKVRKVPNGKSRPIEKVYLPAQETGEK